MATTEISHTQEDSAHTKIPYRRKFSAHARRFSAKIFEKCEKSSCVCGKSSCVRGKSSCVCEISVLGTKKPYTMSDHLKLVQ